MKYVFYGCTYEKVLRRICELMNASMQGDIEQLLRQSGVVAFSDRSEEKWGGVHYDLQVLAPQELGGIEYDKIVISGLSVDSILNDLINKYGIEQGKIIDCYARAISNTRSNFVRTMAHMLKERGIKGNVAEGGVFKGDFSIVINEAFPDRMLYLFDTFEGFAEKDMVRDEAFLKSGKSHAYFKDTSEDMVVSRLQYPEKAIVVKGWFPQSAQGIDDTFAFVNLDFDLYSPIKAGLEWFYPRMERGGVILVHDYFSDAFGGCKQAVDEFIENKEIYPFPIGDVLSVGIIKH